MRTLAGHTVLATGMFEGVTTPRLTRPPNPARLARLTVSAVLRDRPLVLTPWLARITPVLRGTLPRFAFDALAKMFGVTTGMAGWKGRGPIP